MTWNKRYGQYVIQCWV